MKPTQLIKYLEFAIPNKFGVLIIGAPGIGKSDITETVARNLNYHLILDHPAISDPTDFKGLPFAGEQEALFLPFKNLKAAITATEPTLFFLDDLGQAPAAVQAAVMQLLLARRIGEHKVSDHVTFIAASNRKEDKANVTGILEPVKSRFGGGIIKLETDANDWAKWAVTQKDIPYELVAFIRFKPDLINNFNPSKGMTNTASPRTVTSAGRLQSKGLPAEFYHEVFAGVAGEEFATEYTAFLKLINELPSLDEIIMNPTGTPVPSKPDQCFALSAGLAQRASNTNFDSIYTYMKRMKPEFTVACIQDAVVRNPEVAKTKTFQEFGVTYQNAIN